MFVLLATLTLIDSALADTITLETGVTIEGDLARYEMGGDCQVSVTEGDLQGVIVIVPCHRIAAFVRAPQAAPVVVSVIEPISAATIREESLDEIATLHASEPNYAVVPPAASALAPEAELPTQMPVVESSDDPPFTDEGDAIPEGDELDDYDGDADDAITQPRPAPLMPSVSTRSISF